MRSGPRTTPVVDGLIRTPVRRPRFWTASTSTRDPGSLIRGLTAAALVAILPEMFIVTEEDAAAVRKTFEQEGELSAAIELRRRFPGIADNARARECARSIAGWSQLPTRPAKVVRLRPRKDR
jgi:hypothetical protein